MVDINTRNYDPSVDVEYMYVIISHMTVLCTLIKPNAGI